jgi:hypothetical protein
MAVTGGDQLTYGQRAGARKNHLVPRFDLQRWAENDRVRATDLDPSAPSQPAPGVLGDVAALVFGEVDVGGVRGLSGGQEGGEALPERRGGGQVRR